MPFFNLPSASSGGAAVLTGIGAPSNSLGTDGQLYIDTQGRVIFVKTAGDWGAGVAIDSAVDWADLTGAPATFPPSSHGHEIADVSGLSSALDGKQPAGSYANSTHSHVAADITDRDTALVTSVNGQAGAVTISVSAPSWSEITDKPSTFPPAGHDHSAANITDFATQAALYGPVVSVNGQTGAVVVDAGTTLSDALPQPIGTASAGTSSEAARADHVHGDTPVDGGDFDGEPIISFTAQPTNQTAANGAATFTVAATSTVGTVYYQWQSSVDGVLWTNLVSQQNATLSLVNLTANDNGRQFRAAAFTVGAPTIYSNRATLTVSESAYDPNTELLLHFDGAQASTNVLDSSQLGHVFTREVLGNPSAQVFIDNAQGKFSQSLRIATDSSASVAYRNVRGGIDPTTKWFGTTELQRVWTIEFFAYVTSLYQLYENSVIVGVTGRWWADFGVNWQSGLSNADFGIGFGQGGLRAILGGEVVQDDDAANQWLANYTNIVPLNQWNHFAVVRDNLTVRLFLNGVLRKTGTLQNNDAMGFHSSLWIGAVATAVAPNERYSIWNGWLDELRYSRAALYTSNFTPPQSPYPDYAP